MIIQKVLSLRDGWATFYKFCLLFILRMKDLVDFLNEIALYCIVLYCIVLYCIVLYRIVLYCMLKSAAPPLSRRK